MRRFRPSGGRPHAPWGQPGHVGIVQFEDRIDLEGGAPRSLPGALDVSDRSQTVIAAPDATEMAA